MSVPHSQWLFNSFVRIFDSGPEKNNTLAWTASGSPSSGVAEIPAGLYPFGVDGYWDEINGVWNQYDIVVFGRETLLGALTTALSESANNGVFLSLETGMSRPLGTGSPTGKIRGWANRTNFALKWAHASTTVDPAWFGIARTAGTYPDSTFGVSSPPVVISQMSSTLALVGQRVLGAEPQYESFKEVGVRAGDGSSSWKTFGDGVDEISKFVVNVAGLPRDGVDSGFHSLRRWYRQLRFARARRRFIYFPDLGQFNAWTPAFEFPKAWDPDDTAKDRRWGWRDMALNPLELPAFEDVRRWASSNREWRLELPVVSFRE
jgi:hypothetical protein